MTSTLETAPRRRLDVSPAVRGAFLVLFAVGGVTNYSLPIYLDHLTSDRHLGLSGTSAATGAFYIAGSTVGLLLAKRINRSDPRRFIIGGAVVGGLSVIGIGQTTQLWQAYLTYAGMGISFLACGLTPAMVIVLRHADPRRRVTTLAIASMGISLGGAAVSPLTAWLIDSVGLSIAGLVLGCALALVVVGIAGFVMPASPPPATADAPAMTDVATRRSGDITMREAVRTRAMWLLAVANAFFSAAQVAAVAHLVRLGVERHLGIASLLVAVTTASAAAARFIGSAAMQRIPLWTWTIALFALEACSMALLALGTSTWVISLGCVLLGQALGNTAVIFPLLVVDTFGMRDYVRIFAAQQAVTAVAQALGPATLSLAHNQTGGYRGGYLAVTGINVIALVAILAARRAASTLHRADQPRGPRADSPSPETVGGCHE